MTNAELLEWERTHSWDPPWPPPQMVQSEGRPVESYDRFYRTAETMAAGGSRMRSQVLKYIGVAAIAALLTLAGMTVRSTRQEWRGMRNEILAMRVLVLGDASKSLVGEVERRRIEESERKAAVAAAKVKATGTPTPEVPKP